MDSKRRLRPRVPSLIAGVHPFDRLCDEMMEKVLSYLPRSELWTLKLVSLRWRAIIGTYLRHCLDLGQFKRPSDYRKAIDHVLPAMPYLYGLRGLRLRDINAVQKHCKQLKLIEVLQRSRNPRNMKQLCTGFPSLQEVTLPKRTVDGEVEILLTYKPRLRVLVLDGTNITGTCLQNLPKFLETISVSRCSSLLPASQLRLPRCPKLREVRVVDEETRRRLLSSEADLAALLDSYPGLTTLVLDRTDVMGTSFQQLPAGLEHLSMVGCRQIHLPCLHHIASCTQLRHLDVGASEAIHDVDIAPVLAGCQRLTTLILAATEVTGECFSHLPRSLERLMLYSCSSIQQENLFHLTRCDQLRWLNLACSGVTEENMSAILTACPHLELLDASSRGAPIEKCLPLGGHHGLRRLDFVSNLELTDSSLLAMLVQLPQLEVLYLTFCFNVTEDGLECLQFFPKLHTLFLSEMSVTNVVLDKLQGTRLRRLGLDLTDDEAGITSQAVTDLVLNCTSLSELLFAAEDIDSVHNNDENENSEEEDDDPYVSPYERNLRLNIVDILARRLPRDRVVTLGMEDVVLEERPDLVVDSDAAGRNVSSRVSGPLRLVNWRMKDRWDAEVQWQMYLPQ